MKFILNFLFFLSTYSIYACDCDQPSITEKFTLSQFVADVTIIKIYPNKKDEIGYKADVTINSLYKGQKINSIYVKGLYNNGIGSSCDIFIPVDTRLIVYASKNKNNNYDVGMCSGLLYLLPAEIPQKKINRELKILDVLKEKKVSFTHDIYFYNKSKLYDSLKQFDGIYLKKAYSIYEVTFNSDLSIKEVKAISKFNHAIDEKLKQFLIESRWSSYVDGRDDEVPKNTKLLFAFYFYPNKKENKGIISTYY